MSPARRAQFGRLFPVPPGRIDSAAPQLKSVFENHGQSFSQALLGQLPLEVLDNIAQPTLFLGVVGVFEQGLDPVIGAHADGVSLGFEALGEGGLARSRQATDEGQGAGGGESART